jgi:hypothetical protein
MHDWILNKYACFLVCLILLVYFWVSVTPAWDSLRIPGWPQGGESLASVPHVHRLQNVPQCSALRCISLCLCFSYWIVYKFFKLNMLHWNLIVMLSSKLLKVLCSQFLFLYNEYNKLNKKLESHNPFPYPNLYTVLFFFFNTFVILPLFHLYYH